jgi:hypothetical protein
VDVGILSVPFDFTRDIAEVLAPLQVECESADETERFVRSWKHVLGIATSGFRALTLPFPTMWVTTPVFHYKTGGMIRVAYAPFLRRVIELTAELTYDQLAEGQAHLSALTADAS